ncbi:MAG TPA: hypothetical protein VF006_24585 [Longimicrobium sp.]
MVDDGQEYTLPYTAIRNSQGWDGPPVSSGSRDVAIRMGERVMFAEPPRGSYAKGKHYNGRFVWVEPEDFEPA